ncbi:MAG: heme-binding protein [Rhodospirillaceae bacterium]|jgi:uncharacterized protein GlcG (DUF336 family)|nr:heme-binding protein [Rhodospirillaceae bacterium]MBT5457615.1 heme-binding protein [Rhodospirillaceae bacterium]
MRAITLDQANSIITLSFEHAGKLGLKPLTIIVLDAGGRVKAFQKQDGSALLRFEIAYGKAFAALGMGRSSKLVLQKYRDKPKFMENLEQLSDGPIFLEGGAQLILDEHGEVVGAVGITGDTNEMDDECAFAGIRGTGFVVDENQYEGDAP